MVMHKSGFRRPAWGLGGVGLAWRFLVLCALICCTSVVGQYSQYQDQYGFTCQGTSAINAMNNCPDRGSQRGSAGGNVSIHMRWAYNLPNKDFSGPVAGVSDPYVKITAGDVVAKTGVIRNNLNPVWDQTINIGFMLSGALMTVEIFDYDIGVELDDDLLVSSTLRVPFCTTFHANKTSDQCDQVFGCSADDSLWKVPERQMCNETGIVSFVNGRNCLSPQGICLFLDVLIVPFQFEVAHMNIPENIKVEPVLGVAGPPSVPIWTTVNNFGSPFAYDNGRFLDMNIQEASTIKGALIMRMFENEKGRGRANAVNFYAAINFPATIYVCRSETDNLKAIPSWLTSAPWSGRNTSVVKLKLSTGTEYYGCFFRDSIGTTKNKWGGIKKDSIAFYTNTVPGYDNDLTADYAYYTSHYIVLAMPKAIQVPEEITEILYDYAAFLNSLFSYGLIWWWLSFLVARFLYKINYRIDRISSWLVGHDIAGEKVESKLIASLFLSYQQTPCNVDFRGHVYHATNTMLFLVMLPNLLLIGWGINCSYNVKPSTLGYGIMFLGLSGNFLWYGFKLWEVQHWRLSYISLASLAISVLSFFMFMVTTIFTTTSVVVYGHELNFAAISTMFGTINTIPLLLIVFKEDRTFKVNMTNVLEKMTDAAFKFMNKDRKGKDKKKPMKSERILQTLLGNCYTMNVKVPIYKYAPIINDPPEEIEKDPDFAYDDDHPYGDPLYNTSLLFLFIYMLIALSRTAYPSLAFLNCIVLVTFDTIISSISKGDTTWTPGYKICLVIVGRLLVMGSTPSSWVVNYSLAYLVYATALTQEMINKFLPILSIRESGEIAFAGKDPSDEHENFDIASTSYFNLGFLTFAFMAVLVVCAYADVTSELPAPYVDVAGAQWTVYTFGVIAIAFVLCGGLLVAAMRAFYLQKHGLLRGWARQGFMWRDSISTPIMLAIYSEVSILATGVLIYAITEANAVLIIAIYLPIIIALLGYAYSIWLHNDYILIVWPPVEAVLSLETHGADDLEIAFHMIENLFGEEAKGTEEEEGPETDIPEEKTLKGFKLPELKSTGNQVDADIKMPPLPLKSVLRRKRQNLGIKTKSTAVKDLRGRDGADGDKFGNGEDGDESLEAADPWADFAGGDDKEEEHKNAGKLKEKPKYEIKSRGGFANLPIFYYADDFLSQYSAYLVVKKKFGECWKHTKKRLRKYSKIKLAGEDDDLDGDEDEENEDDDDGPASEDLTKMPFWTAVFTGYLSKEEYYALGGWFGGMLAVMFMGITLSENVPPKFLGNVVWVILYIIILTSILVIKYFRTFTLDQTMKEIIGFLFILHFCFTFSFFGITLNSDVGLPGTLWITDYFFYYPALVYMLMELIKWREMGFVIIALDQDGDGEVTMREYVEYFQAYPLILIMGIVLTWQFYLWISYLMGNVFLLVLLTGTVGYAFVRDWAINDFFLSPELSTAGGWMITIILYSTGAASLLSESNPLFSISVFFFTLIAQQTTKLVVRYMIADSDTIIFFSPFLFPVYSYNPKTNDVTNETEDAKQLINLLLMGAAWGASICVFLYPINVGIFVACSFLMIIAAVIATGLSYVPQRLGRYASMISSEGVLEASKIARERFEDRRKPLTIEIKNYEADEDKHAFAPKVETYVQKLQAKPAIELAIDNTSETRGLSYVHDDEDYVAAQTTKIEDEFEKKHWFSEMMGSIWAQIKKFAEVMPSLGAPKGWKKHSEALYDFTDMLAEAIIVGKGPIGWVGLGGELFKLFKYAQENPSLKFLQQPWLNAYDDVGNNKNYVLLSEHIESKSIMARFEDYDKAIDFVCAEETRCAIHFLILMMVSAEAKLSRERVLFQKFLRENRFRLASNGITPPAEIFTSASYSSIDIPLVSVWLSTLSSEERDRFHMLKATFSEEQAERDKGTDTADRKFRDDAENLVEERFENESQKIEKITKDIAKKRNDKITAWADTLHPSERTSFNLRREEWTSNADCFVHFKEQSLYDKFKEACVSGQDESIDHGRLELAELEACLRDSRLGEYGRSYQFVDSNFPPGDSSIGESAAASQILGWRCAPGVVDEINLFSNGTDPNDVNAGIFDNQWLLSAISMVATSGGGGVDGQVAKALGDLFIGHFGVDGEITHNTEVGAFCLRIFKQGLWIPVVVDDLFPMLQRDDWTNENRGLANAHAHECSSIWVSLLEKAIAKFYGSYGELNRGFVHHALTDLTGSESECISLSSASRGAGRRALWDSIIKYQKYGYIIGAGTGSAALMDKEITEMGITFNASYPIYSAWNIDGLHIIKLRNPPGHHDVWKGDFGIGSPLWNSRLKFKLGYNPDDKDVLYMTFDDFCNVFRYLYVCKYYDPDRWTTRAFPGVWKKSLTEDEMEEKKKKGESNEEVNADPETKKRMKAMAKIDTCGGLPSVDNPGCVLENNPHYSLKVYRPTELRIEVSQMDSRGKTSGDPHPFSILVCKNKHPTIPLRLENIGRDDIVERCDEVTSERVRYLDLNLKPGLYTVLVATYIRGMEGTFTVKLISQYRVNFESVWPPKWMMGQEQTSEDVVNELASAAQNEVVQNLKKTWKKGMKIFKELFGVTDKVKRPGVGTGDGEDEGGESDEDYDSDSD